MSTSPKRAKPIAALSVQSAIVGRSPQTKGAFASRAQHGRYLDRMMRVIVDDDRAVPFAHTREAPLDPAESGKRGADEVVAVHGVGLLGFVK